MVKMKLHYIQEKIHKSRRIRWASYLKSIDFCELSFASVLPFPGKAFGRSPSNYENSCKVPNFLVISFS